MRRMPELPEVEAWVRELDRPVSASPVLRAGPAHIATLKTFDPPLRELEGRSWTARGGVASGSSSPPPTTSLCCAIHLMSAGRLRYLALRREGPEDARVPAPLRGRRRARADRGRAEEARRRLARVARADRGGARAPRPGGARARTPTRLREILAADNRRLHSLLRDQRALAGIGRAHANEILHRARLSPFALSTQARRRRDRAAGRRDPGGPRARARAASAREGRQGRLPRPPAARRAVPAGTMRERRPLHRVDYEEHTVFYCPACQTGGRVLKDRRLSRLLK